MRGLRIIALLLFLFVVLSLPVFVKAGSGTDKIKGRVIKIYRDTFFWDNDSAEWKKAINGMRVTMGKVLKTEDNSTMVLEFNKNLVTLGPNSSIGFADFTGENVGGGLIDKWRWTFVVINLVSGELYLKVKEQNEKSVFKVRSGLAVIETRGGEFSVKVKRAVMAKDDPMRLEFLKGVDGIGDAEGDVIVVSGVVSTVVVKGSVTLVNIDTEGNLKGDPVNVGKGETSSILFTYIKRQKNSSGPEGNP